MRPCGHGPVPDRADDPELLTCEHLRHNLAANTAVGVERIDGPARWHVEVASVLHRDEPMGAVRVEEWAQRGRLSGQPFGSSIPQHGVWFTEAGVGVFYAGIDQ